MADHTPGGNNNPLDDRLRATFQAEHDEVERRHLAAEGTAHHNRNLRWIPFAAAAALIAIAGFFFIGNRGPDDQAVDLDIAGQPTQPPGPNTGGDEPQPAATAIAEPVATPVEARFDSGIDLCRPGSYDSVRTVVWNDKDRPVTTVETPVPVETPVTDTARTLLPGTVVELSGGCVQVSTQAGELEWYELRAPDGETDWVLSLSLVSPERFEELTSPTLSQLPLNGCGEPLIVAPFRFIWGIQADDPDGGLVAHTMVGINAPVTRIIERDEIVVVTGNCELSATGSQWRELRGPFGLNDWVSGRYLVEPIGACLNDADSSEAGLPGLAYFDDNGDAAFAPIAAMRYEWYPASRVSRVPCGVDPNVAPCPVFGPLFVWDVAEDDPDGGLLTHTSADVNAPIVRTLRHDQADIEATGNCGESAGGSLWWELAYPGGVDWASGNFLAQSHPACLSHDFVDRDPFFHTVGPGDTLSTIAEEYNVTPELMIASNPGLDATTLRVNQLLRVPAAISGWALGGDQGIAFAPLGASSYAWVPAEDVVIGDQCGRTGGRTPVCV